MNKQKLIKPVIDEREEKAVIEVLRSGWLTEGEKTREFEKQFAEYIGTDYALATTSCTAGLEATLRLNGVGMGDYVIVPDFTHTSTADVIRLVGATPILVDVNIENYCIDWDEVDKILRNFKVSCIIPVSWGGYPLNPKMVKEYRDECLVIEDAACSHGSSHSGVMSGAVADVGVFSFHPRKIITTGEGGMITTSDSELHETLRAYKNFGAKAGKFVAMGTNLRLPDVLGAIGVEQLKKIDEIIEKRTILATQYNELIEDVDWIKTPFNFERGIKHNFQTYAVYLGVDNVRDKIIQELGKKNIETQIGTYALHLQPSFSEVHRAGSLETSESLYRNLLTLPMCHDMDYFDQERVIREIREVVE